MTRRRSKPKPNAGARALDAFLSAPGAPSAVEVSADCGVLPAQLTHLRKGRRIPTLPQALRLKKIAEIEPSAWLEP